jgi:hypothetical protein
MRLLVMPRQVRKTTTLISASQATGIPICVCNNIAKEYLMKQARDYLSSDIPKPVAVNTDRIPSEIFVYELTDDLYRKIILKNPEVKIIAATFLYNSHQCTLEF